MECSTGRDQTAATGLFTRTYLYLAVHLRRMLVDNATVNLNRLQTVAFD